MRGTWGTSIVAGAVALLANGGVAVADAPRAPIPAAQAFELPPAATCVTRRALTFSLRPVTGTEWSGATVKIAGKRVKRVDAAAAKRAIKLKAVPRGRFTLAVTAQTGDGRTAKVERTYQTCIDTPPKISVPAGDPPATLQTRDLVTGSVRTAKRRDEIAVQYSLVTWSDGKKADSSWDRARQPFEFTLGAGMVVEGFDQGIAGMKVGGRREIIVPPGLGYGAAGSGPIKPNETLIFVVDLVSVS